MLLIVITLPINPPTFFDHTIILREDILCVVCCAAELHNIRRTTIIRLILNSVRLTHKNTTCCHSTKVNITK